MSRTESRTITPCLAPLANKATARLGYAPYGVNRSG